MMPFEVLVQFGPLIPVDAQGPVLLAMERTLREQGIPAEVFKDAREDDSRLRSRLKDLELRKKL